MKPTTANIDPAEIARFQIHSDDWWNLKGPQRTLHHINPTRLEFITRAVNLNGKNVLDVGCGGGILSEALAEQGARVTGIDAGRQTIDIARRHARANHLEITYLNTTAEDLAGSRSDSFEVVTCMELLEHVPNPQSLISACARLVQPRGHVFFSTVNRNFLAWLLVIVGAEYIVGLLPRGTHQYQRFVRPAEMRQGLLAAGLEEVQFRGLRYNPLRRRSRLVGDVSVNYLVQACRSA